MYFQPFTLFGSDKSTLKWKWCKIVQVIVCYTHGRYERIELNACACCQKLYSFCHTRRMDWQSVVWAKSTDNIDLHVTNTCTWKRSSLLSSCFALLLSKMGCETTGGNMMWYFPSWLGRNTLNCSFTTLSCMLRACSWACFFAFWVSSAETTHRLSAWEPPGLIYYNALNVIQYMLQCKTIYTTLLSTQCSTICYNTKHFFRIKNDPNSEKMK